MNVGVLGGTFDPIHRGHIIVAEEVRERLNLALTLFVPAGQPWLKTDTPISAQEHRVEMVRLVVADKPYFKLSLVEIERAGASYMADTLAELHAQLGPGKELFLILGCDSLAELPQWHEPAQIIQLAYLVVAPRPGCPSPNLKALEASVPGISRRLMMMESPEIDISASVIRDRVSRGLSVHHLVPEPVNRYIKQHRLYATQ